MSSHRVSIRRQVEATQAGWARQRQRRVQLEAARASVLDAHNRMRHNFRKTRPRKGDDADLSRWASYDHLQELNRTLGFDPLSEEDTSRLETEAQEQASDTVLDRKVCCITDTWVFPKSAVRVRVNELPIKAMQATLTGKPWATRHVTEYYDCPDIDVRLRGLLLSRRGFERDPDGEMYAWMEANSLRDLNAVEARLSTRSHDVEDNHKPPKFAIADRFVAGAYAAIDEATVIERQVVGLAQIRGVIKVVYGGPGNVLQSHLLCWDNRDATIASKLPTVLSRENFQLILAGPMTKPQELLLAKRHECSGDRVQRAHELLRRINPLYATIQVNDEFDPQRCDGEALCSRLESSGDTQQLVEQARARQATVARMNKEASSSEDHECTVVESETVLLETAADRTEHDRLARAFANLTSKRESYVVRRSKSILKQSDPRYLERLFPHLFTFGIGGFLKDRHHRYSQRAIVLHYLNLSTNRFAEDPIFKLTMFDYLSTKRVKSGVFLRVGQDPTLAATVMQISPSELQTAMLNRADQRKAWKSGSNFVPRTESRLATNVLKSIYATTSKMWGSNEEREALTRKVDSMTIQYGSPSVFWTLTPNPDCSLTCAFWSGHPLPHGRPKELSQCVEHNMPCSSEMARLIMGNTFIQAQYYRICCHVLIDVLFGWDTTCNKPKSQRGIFGYVEALLYALEQQGRLFIHHHGVAWVAGFPKTQSDWDRLLTSHELRGRFERYCASIFKAELPVFDNLSEICCPRPNCDGKLNPLSIDKKFKHLLKPTVAAPMVAKCIECKEAFGEVDIVSAAIHKQWMALDEEHQAISTAMAVESIRHRLGGLSPDRATSNVQLSRLLLKDQVHSCTHVRSCIKGRTGTKCRYNFFRDLVETTGFNNADEIVYRRRLGNQWLNMFIHLWRRIFHFNMDARVLWSGHSFQAARYALQYTVKRQTVLDNVAVVEMAFKRRVEREAALKTDEYSQGLGRLLSLAYSTSGVMEIGGPLATAILMEGEAVTFSCTFERLVLLEGLNMLDKAQVQAMIVERNKRLFTETSISKYIERPKCLESYCWYDFCSWFSKANTSTTVATLNCTFTTNDATQLRLHLKQHNYRYFEYPHVPEIIGPRLPDATRLGHEDYATQTELYYRVASLLYHPFRSVESILDESNSAKTFFDSWSPFDEAKTARALERHQQYFICLDAAEKYREEQRTAAKNVNDTCLDDDVLQYSANRFPEELRSRTEYALIPSDLYGADGDMDMDRTDADADTDMDKADGRHLELLFQESALHKLLTHTIKSSDLPEDETRRFNATNAPVTRAHILRFQEMRDETVEPEGSDHNTATAPTLSTTVIVEAFENAIRDTSYTNPSRVVVPIKPYASIREVSDHYKLNSAQHTAFTLIAIPVLTKITGLSVSSRQAKLFNADPIIVTGAGGTGKSQIIAAVRALALAWGQKHAIQVVASTGIAAAGVAGCTMHSSVGLGINTTRLPKNIATPTDRLLRQWAPTLCVIADEVSMIDLAFFSLWEESLRHAKDNPDEPFGGLVAVLMFDHCQLRTVKGAPLFKMPSSTLQLTPTQDRGRHLYRSITKVVYLTENMRFASDVEWGQWLASARMGNWTAQLRSYITSLPEFDTSRSSQHEGNIQVVSTDNATRSTVNEAAIRIAVQSIGHDRRVYVVPARLSRRLSPIEVAMIRVLPDNKTSNIPAFLHVYIGMPVRIKANQCVSKGVANGASGEIYHIDWLPETTFTLQPNGAWLASGQPINIYVNIHNCPSTTRFPLLPLHWPSSVMPVYQTTGPVTIQGPSLSIKGFPIVPSFGTTVHGVQGETRQSIAITNLRPAHVSYVDPHALYVALSRVTTRHGLHWIGDRPSIKDFDYFHPSTEVLLEDARLKHLSNTTTNEVDHLTEEHDRIE